MVVNSVISALFQLVHGRSVQRGDKSLVVESLTSILPLLLDQLQSSQEFLRSSSLQLLVLYAIHKGRRLVLSTLFQQNIFSTELVFVQINICLTNTVYHLL